MDGHKVNLSVCGGQFASLHTVAVVCHMHMRGKCGTVIVNCLQLQNVAQDCLKMIFNPFDRSNCVLDGLQNTDACTLIDLFFRT